MRREGAHHVWGVRSFPERVVAAGASGQPAHVLLPEWPALLAILLWASLATVAGGSLEGLRPSLLVAISFAAAAPTFALIERWRGVRFGALATPRPRDLAVGTLGLGGYHVLLFLAFDLAPLVEANLLNYLWPLLIVLLAAPMAGECLAPRTIASALLGLGGTVLVVGGTRFSADPAAAAGYAAAIAAAITWAVFSNVLKSHPIEPRALPLSALLTSVGAAVWALVERAPAPTPAAVAAGVYLGVLPLAGATVLWELGIRRGRVQVVGTLAYLTPLLSTLGVWLVLGRPLGTHAALGGVLILAGAALGSSARRP